MKTTEPSTHGPRSTTTAQSERNAPEPQPTSIINTSVPVLVEIHSGRDSLKPLQFLTNQPMIVNIKREAQTENESDSRDIESSSESEDEESEYQDHDEGRQAQKTTKKREKETETSASGQPSSKRRPRKFGHKRPPSGNPRETASKKIFRQDSQSKNGLKRTRKRKRKIIELMKRENMEKDTENEILKEELDKQKARFQKIQEESLSRSQKGVVKALDDETVRNMLKKIFNECMKWAHKYQAPIRSNSEATHQEIKKILLGTDGNSMLVSDKGLSAAWDGRFPNKLLLVILVNRLLVCDAFERPFFYLDDISDKNDKVSVERSLMWIQKVGYDRDIGVETESWRASTAQMLHPPGQDSNTPCHKKLEGLKNAVYERAVHEIMSRGRMLLKEVEGEEITMRHAALLRIATDAGNFALTLHTQRQKLKVLYTNQHILEHCKDGFDVGSEIIKAHRSVKIDEGDQSQNGLLFDLLIQPAILAYGSEHGEMYDKFKILSQGEVWIDLGGPKQKKRTTPVNKSRDTIVIEDDEAAKQPPGNTDECPIMAEKGLRIKPSRSDHGQTSAPGNVHETTQSHHSAHAEQDMEGTRSPPPQEVIAKVGSVSAIDPRSDTAINLSEDLPTNSKGGISSEATVKDRADILLQGAAGTQSRKRSRSSGAFVSSSERPPKRTGEVSQCNSVSK